MKRIAAFACALLFVALSSVSWAQDEYEKGVTEYKFLDENVLGDLVGPGGVGITVRKPGKSRSLIKVRKHFVPEMFKSVENI
jgi:hypothetical protein